MTNPCQALVRTDRRAQRGLTLVELMVALALGLLLVAGVGAVYLGSSQTYRAEQDSSRIQEAGRYALDVIGRSLRQAGYASIPHNPASRKTTFTGTTITGTNGSASAPDVVTTQRDWTDGDRSCVDATGAVGQIVQETFSIDTVNAELECDGVILPDPSAGAQPLLNGVEDLQVLYGIDTTGDGSADRYLAAPGNWAQVVTARVCVLIRSENEGIAPASSTYFNCAGALGVVDDATRFTTATDTRLRRAFVATFSLRNRITGIP